MQTLEPQPERWLLTKIARKYIILLLICFVVVRAQPQVFEIALITNIDTEWTTKKVASELELMRLNTHR